MGDIFLPKFRREICRTALITWQGAQTAIAEFFRYLPYNFTIALPIQMLIVVPVSLRLARAIAGS